MAREDYSRHFRSLCLLYDFVSGVVVDTVSVVASRGSPLQLFLPTPMDRSRRSGAKRFLEPYCTKITPKWLSVTSPVALTKKLEVINPWAPANWPSPPSTRHITVPCEREGSGLGPR